MRMQTAAGYVLLFLACATLSTAQTVNTSCTLYPNAAYCSSTVSDRGAAIAAQQHGLSLKLTKLEHLTFAWRQVRKIPFVETAVTPSN